MGYLGEGGCALRRIAIIKRQPWHGPFREGAETKGYVRLRQVPSGHGYIILHIDVIRIIVNSYRAVGIALSCSGW